MFAAVKIYVDPQTKKKRVDLYGLKHVSNGEKECIKYLRDNHHLFTEMSSLFDGAVVEFDPKDFPHTMEYYRQCPNVCICTRDESEAMARNIVYP